MRFEAVLFDLDDTLLDRNRGLERFIELFTGKYAPLMDFSDSRYIKELITEADRQGYRSREEMFAEILDRVDWRPKPQIRELIGFWYDNFPRCAQPADNLYNVLDSLRKRNIKMGIVTNGEAKFQSIKIDVLKVRDYMCTVIISEEADIRKPDKGIFDLALSKLGCENGRTLFVGDNPGTDIKGALNAGLIPVWVSWGREWTEKDFSPAHTIGNLSELTSIW